MNSTSANLTITCRPNSYYHTFAKNKQNNFFLIIFALLDVDLCLHINTFNLYQSNFRHKPVSGTSTFLNRVLGIRKDFVRIRIRIFQFFPDPGPVQCQLNNWQILILNNETAAILKHFKDFLRKYVPYQCVSRFSCEVPRSDPEPS
jgi:hypothetical protein